MHYSTEWGGCRGEQCQNSKRKIVHFFIGGQSIHSLNCWLAEFFLSFDQFCKSYIFSYLHFVQLINRLFFTDIYVAESRERLRF